MASSNFKVFAISIHAPLRERRRQLPDAHGTSLHFNPRSLTGATISELSVAGFSAISIHAPLRERPVWGNPGMGKLVNFNPRSLTGATVSSVC